MPRAIACDRSVGFIFFDFLESFLRNPGTSKGKEETMNVFPRNEHTVERAIRMVLGVALLAIVFVGPKTPWGWVGALPLLTGLLGSCPLYTVLGISTCKVPNNSATES